MKLRATRSPALQPKRPMGAALAKIWATGWAGRKIIFWGDSTTANSLMAERTEFYFGRTRDPLFGATFVDGGSNGVALSVALANGSPNGIDWLIAQAPDVVVACWLINDVRQGNTTLAQAIALLTQMVAAIHAALPDCVIVLWTPNSLLSSDNGTYIVPPAAAQAYTDVMWNAHKAVQGMHPEYTVFIDKQEIFGRASLPSSPMMEDPLHPNMVGIVPSIKQAVEALQSPNWNPPLDLAASAAAWATDPVTPWSIYPRAAEDTRYTTLLGDYRAVSIFPYGGNGNWLLDFTASNPLNGPWPVASDFQTGDIAVLSDKTAPFRSQPGQQGEQTVRVFDFLVAENTMPVEPPLVGRVSIYRRLP